MRKAHIFSNIFKFIDDLFTFNSNYFENDYNDIYPDELELQQETENPSKPTFLDLSIEPHDRKLKTKVAS